MNIKQELEEVQVYIDDKQKRLVKSITDESTPDNQFYDDLMGLCTLNKLSDTIQNDKV